MKQKKNDMVDRAEIIDDPSKRYEELKKIDLDLNSILEIQKNLSTTFNQIQSELKSSISHDPEVKAASTVHCITNFFDKIIKEFASLDSLSSTLREQLYDIIYNISILFYDYINRMRKNKFSIHGTKYLIWIISHLESNIVLSGIKFLKWRIKLYIELSFLYEDYEAFSAAYKTIAQAISKVNDLKAIEEQQGPLPEYIKTIFIDNFKYLKYFEFKYGILSGTFTLDVWKKKLDETFVNEDEKLNKNICMINSVANLSWYNSIVNHDSKKISWKSQAVQYCYDSMKEDITAIKNGITEFIEGKKNEYEMKKQAELNPKKEISEEEQKAIDEAAEKEQQEKEAKEAKDKKKNDPKKNNQKKDSKLEEEQEEKKNLPVVKNFITQSRNVPIEIHVELLKMCYDCEMWKEFIELTDSLNIRIKYRNVEIPYIADIDIQMASVPNLPAKKYYEKIDLDLNINNYKREVKRLREAGKYVNPNENKEKDIQAKDKDPKKNDPKKKGKKDAKDEQVEEKKDPNAYEPIEGLEHNFVFLMVKRSHDPKKAITNIRVKMSNELKIKNELKQNERAIALPIKTFKDNLYEVDESLIQNNENKNDFTANLLNKNTKMLPYLIIKKNITGLETDNEKMSALIDVYPLISNSPFAEAPMNFTKIDPEISLPGKSSDPSYINYNFNHNYINFCYKNDKMLYIIERESEVLRNLYELEISYTDPNVVVNEKDKSNSDANISKVDKFLKLYYPFDKIDTIATWMYNTIQDDNGEFFLKNRSNFLYDICLLLWKKYLKELLYRIDFYYSNQSEIEDTLSKAVLDKISSIQNMIFNTLYCIHYVLSNIKDKDVIIYAYISSRLGDYSERTMNNATGVIVLKDTIDYIERVKEDEALFGINNMENKHTFTSFTCDNNKIYALNKECDELYDAYVRQLNLKRRVNYKKYIMSKDKSTSSIGIKKKINNDEVNEEDFENNYLEGEYTKKLNDNNTKTYDGKSIYTSNEANKDKIKINFYITEYENTLNCIYIDLIIKMYRMYIKTGDAILDKYDYSDITLPKKYTRANSSSSDIGKPVLSSSGKEIKISARNLKKLDIIKGDTAKAVKANMEFLKHSLQDAGKLEPDKPMLSKSEKIMQFSIGKNSYLNSLYQAMLALMRPNSKRDQIFLLRLASANLDKCFEEEKSRYEYYKQNFFYVKSLERYNLNLNQNMYTYYPYNLRLKPIMIDNVDKIPEPILINKTAKTCTFVFPLIKIRNDQLDKIYHNIPKVALYGQISTGSNCVQLTNKTLNHTGEIVSILNHLTVNNLKKNEKYIFAYAGYDDSDVIVNQIGNTSKEVELYFPLPLFYISYQVCKVAFEFRHFAICKDKSKIVFSYFTERSEVKDLNLDSKLNTIHFYKLKYDFVSRTSLFELEGVAFCFYYFAKSVMMLKPEDHRTESGSNVYPRQKNILKNINVLSLGLEIAIYIRHYQLIKTFIVELYNTSVSFLKNKDLYNQLLSVYMKMTLGASMIPNELYDANLRRISSLISYNIFIFANCISEPGVISKSMSLELGISRKRYYPFVYKYMEKIEEDPKAKKKDPAKAKMTPKTPKDVKATPDIDEEAEKFEEKTSVVLKDIERECVELDEFIYASGDYNEIVKARLNNYISILDKYIIMYPEEIYPGIQSEIENRKKDISDVIEVYDGLKAEGVKYIQKYISASKDKEHYYEYVDKMLKKIVENFISGMMPLNTSQYSLNPSDPKKGSAPSKDANNVLAQFPEILKLVDDIVIKEEDINFITNIFNQKISFLNGDILYKLKLRIHDYLNQIKQEMPVDQVNNEIDLDKMGNQIEEKFFGCIVDNEIVPPYATLSDNDILSIKEKLYWIGDIIYNKAIVLYVDFLMVAPNNHQSLMNYDFNNFFNFKLCDLKKINKYGRKDTEDDLKLLDVRSGLFIKKQKKEEINEENAEEKETSKPGTSNKKTKPPTSSKQKKDAKAAQVVEEVIDPFDNHIERHFELRLPQIEKIFEKLALASIIMNDVENYVNFDSLLTFAYNAIIYDMLNPFDTTSCNLWMYINIIAEVALNRLMKCKNGIDNYASYDLMSELSKLKLRITSSTFNSKPSSFTSIPKSNATYTKIDDEKIIAEYEKRINIDIYVEFICFAMQCDYHKEKWSILTNLIENFNRLTNDLFAEFTLSFLIEAQKHIYEKAHLNTTNKQSEINHRVELYENWKNSRKKNKRQQLITGEIPIEQIEFDRDYSILSKELFIFTSISDMLRSDMEKSQTLYNNFLNDANNAMKAVNNCRRKYEEYQIELMSMKKYSYNYTTNYKEFTAKDKAISYLTAQMISSYKTCIQVLKKRQENYLLIQILYEMSLVMYSTGNIKGAEVYFNEALDTVFQMLYSINNFRNIFAIGANATEKYGIKSLLYAICILHKLNKFCYDNNLYLQRESALMAGEITFNILNNVIPHPMIMTKYGCYRISSLNVNFNILKSADNIKINDLVVSLLDMADTLISYGDFEICLPMLSLCEYLSCDICKHVHFTLKSRVMRIVCLSELGMINEAMMMYYKVIKKFDMPTLLSMGYKDYSNGKFANLQSEIKFYNDLPPEDQKNIDAVNAFMKLSVDNDLRVMMGANLYYEFMYMRLCILFKIFNKENFSAYPDKNAFTDLRTEMFMRIEKESRENINTLSLYEDLCYLNNLLKEIKVNDKDAKYVDVVKEKIDAVLNMAKITSEDMKNFVLLGFNKSQVDLSKERYELVFKYRILLSKVFSCQGLSLASSGVLLKAIENYTKIATSNIKIFNFDIGDDFVFDFKPNEVKDPKAKAAPAKKEKAPAAKDKKEKTQSDLPPVNPDEEMNKVLNEIVSLYHGKRIIPNSVYWFKLHYHHLINCYKMGRYNDCMKIISKFNKNSTSVNDVYYFIRAKEIEVMLHIQNYEIEKANEAYNALLSKGKTNFINDYEICFFYANYAEFLYIEGNTELALATLKTARTIIWEKMAKNNYLISTASSNIFNARIVNNLYIDKSLSAILKDRDANFASAQGKKTEQKKGGVSGAEVDTIDFYTVSEVTDDNYDKPKIEYVKGDNLYNRYTDLICKIEIKYLLFNFLAKSYTKMSSMKVILSVIKDLEVMMKKQLYPHSYYSIVVNYIYGMISKIDFVTDLRDFLYNRFNTNVKLLKKNGLDVLTLNKKILFTFSSYYNESVVLKWIPMLLKSKEYFEKALTLSKSEFISLENTFSISLITSALADVNMLLAEYSVKNEFKFCDVNMVVQKIQNLIKKEIFYDKEDDDLPLLPEETASDDVKEEKKKFIEDKTKKEKSDNINYLKNFLYYSDMTLKINSIRKLITDNVTDLTSTSLTLIDASKLPRDLYLQIIESDLLLKKKNKNFVTNISPKPNIDANDVFSLLKSFIKESDYFTFNFATESNVDEIAKNINKVHKFLKGNSSSYLQKCIIDYSVPSYDDKTDNYDFINADSIYVNYIVNDYETINHVSPLSGVVNESNEKFINMVYLLGKSSTSTESECLYGRVMIKEKFIQEMNIKIYNMKIKVRQSMTFSEEKKKRDFKYYQIEYYAMMYEFIKEMLRGKKQFNEMKNVKDAFKDEDIGEVTIEALDFWFNFLNFETYQTTNTKYNALLRKIHSSLV